MAGRSTGWPTGRLAGRREGKGREGEEEEERKEMGGSEGMGGRELGRRRFALPFRSLSPPPPLFFYFLESSRDFRRVPESSGAFLNIFEDFERIPEISRDPQCPNSLPGVWGSLGVFGNLRKSRAGRKKKEREGKRRRRGEGKKGKEGKGRRGGHLPAHQSACPPFLPFLSFPTLPAYSWRRGKEGEAK